MRRRAVWVWLVVVGVAGAAAWSFYWYGAWRAWHETIGFDMKVALESAGMTLLLGVVWPLGLVLLGIGVWDRRRERQRAARVARGCCAACGYSMDPQTACCPECGADWRSVRTPPPIRLRRVIVAAIALLTGWAMGSVLAERRLMADDAEFREEIKAHPTGRWWRSRWWPHRHAILGVENGVVWSHAD